AVLDYVGPEGCLYVYPAGKPRPGGGAARRPFPATALPVYAVRAAFSTLPSDVGSAMSVATREGGELPAAAGGAPLGGAVVGGGLEAGRLLRPEADGEAAPLAESRDDGFLLRLDLKEQGLLEPSPAADASRSRAFLATLCWAVEAVVSPRGR